MNSRSTASEEYGEASGGGLLEPSRDREAVKDYDGDDPREEEWGVSAMRRDSAFRGSSLGSNAIPRRCQPEGLPGSRATRTQPDRGLAPSLDLALLSGRGDLVGPLRGLRC